MASYTNAYDKLYNNMKNAFTVVNDGSECTLGEYMLKRAKEKQNTSNLPVSLYGKDNAVAAIYSYVSDKLTIKTPPVKDKTIKSFPFRSCAAAMLSAVVTCTVLFSYGNYVVGENDKAAYVIEAEEEENKLQETVNAESSQDK